MPLKLDKPTATAKPGNTIKGSVHINYNWKRADGKKIKPAHKEALHERAPEIAFEKIAEGYTSGELQDYVRMGRGDGPDGIHYTGWWEVSYDPNLV